MIKPSRSNLPSWNFRDVAAFNLPTFLETETCLAGFLTIPLLLRYPGASLAGPAESPYSLIQPSFEKIGNVEIKGQKHGCSIGSSTPNTPIKTPEARSPFPDLSYQRLWTGNLFISNSHCQILIVSDIPPLYQSLTNFFLSLKNYVYIITAFLFFFHIHSANLLYSCTSLS